jgi:hypothetical protein
MSKLGSGRRTIARRRVHWGGGTLTQPPVSDAQMTAIIRFVRELRRANGITYRPHRM